MDTDAQVGRQIARQPADRLFRDLSGDPVVTHERALGRRWANAMKREDQARCADRGLREKSPQRNIDQHGVGCMQRNVHRMADANKAFAHFAW